MDTYSKSGWLQIISIWFNMSNQSVVLCFKSIMKGCCKDLWTTTFCFDLEFTICIFKSNTSSLAMATIIPLWYEVNCINEINSFMVGWTSSSPSSTNVTIPWHAVWLMTGLASSHFFFSNFISGSWKNGKKCLLLQNEGGSDRGM